MQVIYLAWGIKYKEQIRMKYSWWSDWNMWLAGGRNTRRGGRDLWPFCCWTQRLLLYKEALKSSAAAKSKPSPFQYLKYCALLTISVSSIHPALGSLIWNGRMHLREATVLVGRAVTAASRPNYRQSPRLIWPASAYILSAYVLHLPIFCICLYSVCLCL